MSLEGSYRTSPDYQPLDFGRVFFPLVFPYVYHGPDDAHFTWD